MPGTGKDGALQYLKAKSEGEATRVGGVSEVETRYRFLISNLRFAAALCEGHGRQQVTLVKVMGDMNTLFEVVKSIDLPHEVRHVAADTLFEVHVDTAGALKVLSESRSQQVFVWETGSSNTRSNVLESMNKGDRHDEELRTMNAERLEYCKWLVEWVRKESGFRRDLRTFSVEMIRIIKFNDEFEKWHEDHGSFILVILRNLFFFTEAGYFADNEFESIKCILEVLIQDLFVYMKEMISTDVTTNEADMRRNALIGAVIEQALKIVELIQVHHLQTSMSAFFEDFYAVSTSSRREKGHESLQKLAKLKNENDQGVARHGATLFNLDDIPDRDDKFPIRDADGKSKFRESREYVMQYLEDLFDRTSLEKWCSIAALTTIGYEKKKTELKAIVQQGVNGQQGFLESSTGFDLDSEGYMLSTFDDILVDVIERGNPEEVDEFKSNIVMIAMRIIERFYSAENRLFRECDDVRILVDDASKQVFQKASTVLPQLEYIVEDMQINDIEAARISYLVEDLIEALKDEAGEPVPAFQDILYKMNALEIVLSVFDQKLDDDDIENDQSVVSKAMVTCLKFVSLLTRGSDQAMDRMFDELPNLLASENTEGPVVSAQMASTLSEVFAKPKFQLKVRARDLQQIMDRMFDLFEDGKQVAELLDLLRSMADSTGSDAGMQRNQQLIVSYLMQHESNVIDVLFVKKMGALRKLLEKDDGINENYKYHISLVELLAMLADGQNQFIESICKKLFSIDDVLTILVENKDINAGFGQLGATDVALRKRTTFQAYLRVLHDVYLSENCLLRMQSNIPISGDPRIWDVVCTVCGELHAFATNTDGGYLKRDDVPYVLKMLKFLFAFFGRHFRPDGLRSERENGEDPDGGDEFTTGFGDLNVEEDDVSLHSVDDDDAAPSTGDVFTKSKAESLSQEFAPKIAEAVALIAFANGGRERWVQGERLARKLVMVILQNSRNFKTTEEWRNTTTTIRSFGPLKGLSEEQLVNLDVNSLREIHFARRDAAQIEFKARKQSGVVFRGADAVESETQTVAFRAFVVTFKLMYWNKNNNYHECHKKGFGTGGKARNPECFYLQEGDDDDDESILPCGSEYQQLLKLFLTRDGKPSDHGFKALLRYLGFLQMIFEDVGATDNEREDAETQVVTTLKLLSAMMMKYRCESFCGSEYLNEQTELRREINSQMHLMQTKMALSGAAEHCINLIANEEDDVMKSAFRYFMMILLDGNVQVQELAIVAFRKESKSSGALGRLREELVRGIAALRQLRQAQYKAETVSTEGIGQQGLLGSVSGSVHGSMRGSINSKESVDFKGIDLIQVSLKAVGSKITKGDIDEDRDINDDEFRWVMSVAGGIQLMAEGQFKPIQDYLREQKSSKGQSVNFVAELCKALQQVFMNIGQGEQWQREQWLILIDRLLDAITELCQGNQINQQEARDEQIIKMVNAIVAYDTATEFDLEALTATKRAALAVIESMLELNNDAAQETAKQLTVELNLEEVCLAMNRFYYIDFYLKSLDRLPSSPYSDESRLLALHAAQNTNEDILDLSVDAYTSKHVEAGHKCYYILARIEDLTGYHYEWAKKKEDEIAKSVAKQGMELKDGRNQNDDDESSQALEEFHDLDEHIFDRFERWLEQQKRTGTKPESLYMEFSRQFLIELDRHGGANLGKDCDRLGYFQARTRSIEILRDNELQKIYFESPSTLISKAVRTEILLSLKLTSPQDKVRGFIATWSKIRRMLRKQHKLRSNMVTRLISEGTGFYWKWASLAVSYALNVAMLVAYKAPDSPYEITPVLPVWFDILLPVLGTIHFVLAIVITSEFFVNESELTSGAVYHIIFVLFSFLGLFFHGYFYAFHLVHIVRDHDMLNRAIESITRNGASLLAVTALAITAVYVFSIVAFLFFRMDYDSEDGKYCDSLLQCFATTLTWGLTHGGGLREVLLPGNSMGHPDDYRYIFRIVFDLLFWVTLSIIAMNLVLGIIVDTFSQLRSERERSIEELTNQCFICSLPTHHFGTQFEKHIKEEHNMWDVSFNAARIMFRS